MGEYIYLDIFKAIAGVYILLIGFNVFKKYKDDLKKQEEWSAKYSLLFKIGGTLLFIYSTYKLVVAYL